MTYIRDLDPQWSDPALSTPWTCDHCHWTGTWEDTRAVTSGSLMGHLCPRCTLVTWDGDTEVPDVLPPLPGTRRTTTQVDRHGYPILED